MKRTIKSFISLLTVVVLMLSVFAVNTLAAGTVISLNKKSVTVGDTVKVTITFNAGEAMYGVEGVVNYDSNVLEYKDGNATGSAGVLKIVESPSGDTKVSYTLTFTAKKAGSGTVSVSDSFYAGETIDKGLSGSSATVSVTDKTLSSNANLKSMYLSAGSLSPSFSPSVTSYEVKVKNSVTECKVSATPSDSNARVSVEGSATLSIGSNTRKVIVTAPSGATKTYTLTIIRSETDEEVPVEANPLEIDIEGDKMLIATDISSVKLFGGFTASQVDFGGNNVAVAVSADNEYTIYYLRKPEEATLVPYTYDEASGVFEKLNYITQGENSYILADIPFEKSVPHSFYTTSTQINGINVKCYATSGIDMSDFYYIYCYANGSYGFYRYDSRENVLQRYPELKLADIDAEANAQVDTEKPDSFFARFKLLSTNAKIIVIAFVFLILAIIALITIGIIRLAGRRKYDQFSEGMFYEEDFDNVTVDNTEDNNSLIQ